MQEVYTLIIDHGYGFDCTVYSSYEKAKSYLYNHVAFAWRFENTEMPIDRDKAIDEFFKIHRDKFWVIDKHVIDEFVVKEEKHENL